MTKPNRQVQGAGPLESDDKRGVFLPPLDAMTEEGLPLGIVDQVIWTRDKINTDLTKTEKAQLRRQAAFEEKESYRWLDMFQSGEQIARANPGTNYTVVGDSESDICEIFAEVGDLPENCQFVIRGCQNRAVMNCGAAANIDEALETAGIQFTSEVTIRGPARPGGKLPNMTLNLVEAVELDPPAGEEPIRWVLFTTLSIDSIAQIQRVISTYSTRWNIELYFKTLKSGLKIEQLKYETLDRYLTALSMLMIAELGGWQRKNSQGPPGSMTIWRGLRRMEAYADAFQAFKKATLRCGG